MLKSPPPHETIEQGVGTPCSPDRPEPVAFSVVDLPGHEGSGIIVREQDAIDRTPVVGIKPGPPGIDRVT